MADKLTPEAHRHQIDAYTRELPAYKVYASSLKRVLEQACKVSIPEALVQSRPKSVSSFAEKCVRKHGKYKDAVHDMTDLCGARVIVQTLEQVKAVRQFIEANFKIEEKDEKGLSLATDEFGYRDMHYIVRVLPGTAEPLGFTPEELAAIEDRRAEVQVRTWVQHAWADTLHDRMYKTKLRYPEEFKRTGALLAAIMEDGDRAFDRLALDIDGMLANYSAYATKANVEAELGVLTLILANAAPEEKPATAVQLSRLLAAGGDFAGVVRELSPFADIKGPIRCEVLLELGFAVCQVHRGKPASRDYKRGQKFLKEVVSHCTTAVLTAVPALRKRTSVHARALSRLAWTWEAVGGKKREARDCYREALKLEPANPYYLAEVIGYEASCASNPDIAACMRAQLETAIKTCREHALAGTEMPYACFTAGRLSLLADKDDTRYEALGWFARGVRHLNDDEAMAPRGLLAAEIRWLERVAGSDPTPAFEWARRYLRIAQAVVDHDQEAREDVTDDRPEPLPITAPVLVVSGGAGTLSPLTGNAVRKVLLDPLMHVRGTVVAGGTKVGIPGCAGDVAAALAAEEKKEFRLIGYVTGKRRADAPRHPAYDDLDESGSEFTPEHLLRYWADMLVGGVSPAEVRLIGFGGGPLSAIEYRLALGLGALVAIAGSDGDAADALLGDRVWSGDPNLYALPFDAMTIRALVVPCVEKVPESALLEMAKAFHAEYVRSSPGKLPENMRPWPKLGDTYRKANLAQARYSTQILEACGFVVKPAADPEKPVFFDPEGFSPEEIERMAEMEHGRWNAERLGEGWRFGPEKDEKAKTNPCLVPWSALPDDTKFYDRNSVRQFPRLLAEAGLEVNRRK